MSKHRYPDEEFDDDTIFKRHRWLLPLIIIVAVGGIGYAASKIKVEPSAPPRPMERMMTITLPPPPPIVQPPPPPKVEPPPEDKKEEMLEQEEVKPDEVKEPEPKPSDDPPPIGTNNVGSGPPDGFGLGAYKGGAGGSGGGSGRSGRGGSKFGWYAGQVQTRIADALRSNGRTRNASLSLQVRIWADSSGRITRASLVGSSGDNSMDSAIANEILTGLQLQEAPPADMPMPINLRITARKS